MEMREFDVCSRGHAVSLEGLRVAGWFGRDLEGAYSEEASVARYLQLPPSPAVNFDLTVTHRDDQTKTAGGHIDHMYRWIVNHSRDARGNPKKPEENFIGYRTFFKKLLSTPYEELEGWDVFATRLRGSTYLYLEEQQKKGGQVASVVKKDTEGSDMEPGMKLTEDDVQKLADGVDSALVLKIKNMKLSSDKADDAAGKLIVEVDDFDENSIYSRYGNKFEHYLLSDTPGAAPNPDQPLTRFDDMSCVMSAVLGRHRLLYAGEMDGLPTADALQDLSAAKFVELKTVRENGNPHSFKRYKLLKFWTQCVLADCRTVLLGHRDDAHGVVRRLEQIPVSDIPRMAEFLWEPSVCFSFLYGFLNFVESMVSEAPEETMFQFQWRPKERDVVRGVRFPPQEKAWIVPRFYRAWLDTIPAEEEGVEKRPEVAPQPAAPKRENVNTFMPSWM